VLSGVQKLRKPDADSETFFSETYLSGWYDYYRFMAIAVLTIRCFDCSRNLIRTVEHPFNGISISSGYDYYHFMARLSWEGLLPRSFWGGPCSPGLSNVATRSNAVPAHCCLGLSALSTGAVRGMLLWPVSVSMPQAAEKIIVSVSMARAAENIIRCDSSNCLAVLDHSGCYNVSRGRFDY
jgi:hypothetical protein